MREVFVFKFLQLYEHQVVSMPYFGRNDLVIERVWRSRGRWFLAGEAVSTKQILKISATCGVDETENKGYPAWP